MSKKKEYIQDEKEYVVKLSDFHVPYQDDKAINVAIKYIKYLQPKIIVLDEVIDFYAISKFDKQPDRKLTLQDDLYITKDILLQIRKACPNSRIVMVESNHDMRLRKYLWSKAEELSVLECLKIEKLMGLKELNIEYRKDFIYKGVLYKHGNIVRQDSSYTAKAEFIKEGMSGNSGHTHRLGVHYKTLRGGSYVWIEGGCLADPKKAEYITGTADWQQGISVWGFSRTSDHFYATVLPIIKDKIYWGNKTFKGDK